MFPHVVRHTVGVVAVGARKYIDWVAVLYRCVMLCLMGTPHLSLLVDITPSLAGRWPAGSPSNRSSILASQTT